MAKKEAGAKETGILTSTKAVRKNPDSQETADPSVTTTEVGAAKPAAFKALGELDAFGFGSKTEISFVLSILEDGSLTKPEIIEAFVKKFATDAGDAKRKKSSLSVIFSDLAKPFGVYHASRSLPVIKNEETGVLSLDPKRLELVKKAIHSGIMASLKGFNMKKHPDKVKTVLRKHGLPVE